MTARHAVEPRRSFNSAGASPAAAALLCVAALGTGPVRAQSSQDQIKAFEQRIEEVGQSFADSPRFKGLTPQQRKDRMEFVIGNTLFIVLHEMGHAYIHEMRLPILGREEDAADTFAALRLLAVGSLLSQRVLGDSAKGWFFSDRREQQTGSPLLYYDEHNLSRQRAYEIVCLMVGSDPVKLKDLAEKTKLPEARREKCKQEYVYAAWSWETVLAPHRRAPGEPKTEINVVYGDGKGQFDLYAQLFRSIRLLETVAEVAAENYAWPAPFTLEMQACGGPNAGWDDDRRTLRICYELPFDFSELYIAYATAPLVDVAPRATPPNDGKAASIGRAQSVQRRRAR